MPSPVKITKRRQAHVKATDVRTAGVAPTFNLLGSRVAQDGATWDDHYKRAHAVLAQDAARPAIERVVGWDDHYEQARAKLAQQVDDPFVDRVARAVMSDPKLQAQLASSGKTPQQFHQELVSDPTRLAQLVAEQRGPGWRNVISELGNPNARVVDTNAVPAELGETPRALGFDVAAPILNRVPGGWIGQQLAGAGAFNAATPAPQGRVDRPQTSQLLSVYEQGQQLKALEAQREQAVGPQAAQLDQQINQQTQRLGQLMREVQQPDEGPSAWERAKDLAGTASTGLGRTFYTPLTQIPDAMRSRRMTGEQNAQTLGSTAGSSYAFPRIMQAARAAETGSPLLLRPLAASTLGGEIAGAATRLPQIFAAGARSVPVASLLAAAPNSLWQGYRRSYTGEGQDELREKAYELDKQLRRGGVGERVGQELSGLGNLFGRLDPLQEQGLRARDALRAFGPADPFQSEREQEEAGTRVRQYEADANKAFEQMLPGLKPGQRGELARAAAVRRSHVDDRWDAPNTQADVQAVPETLANLHQQGFLSQPMNGQQTARFTQLVRATGLQPALSGLFTDEYYNSTSPADIKHGLAVLNSPDAPMSPPEHAYLNGPRWQVGAVNQPVSATPGHVSPAPASTMPTPKDVAYRQAIANEQAAREAGIAQRGADVQAQSKATWDRLRATYGPDIGKGPVDRGIPWGGDNPARMDVAKPFVPTPQITPHPDPQWAPPAYQVEQSHEAATAQGKPWTPPYMNMAAWIKGGPPAAATTPPAVTPPTTPTPAVQPPVLAQNGSP